MLFCNTANVFIHCETYRKKRLVRRRILQREVAMMEIADIRSD